MISCECNTKPGLTGSLRLSDAFNVVRLSLLNRSWLMLIYAEHLMQFTLYLQSAETHNSRLFLSGVYHLRLVYNFVDRLQQVTEIK